MMGNYWRLGNSLTGLAMPVHAVSFRSLVLAFGFVLLKCLVLLSLKNNL